MPEGQALSDFLKLSARTSTFVSIDVVGSTALKAGETEQDVLYTFLAYHKLVSEVSYQHHGEVIHITGDGLMCRFQKASDAAAMTASVLNTIPEFNKKQNRLSHALLIRIGLHTGEVLEGEGQEGGQIISQTLDITAKLQQAAEAGHARLSEATVSAIADGEKLFKRMGWNAALQVNMYDYSIQGSTRIKARKIPSPARVLIVEPDLDEVARLRKGLFGRALDVFVVYTQNQSAIPLTHWKPHLTVLSLDLPWDTGWEMLNSIRATQSLSSMPVIASSRASTGDIIQKSFKQGANGFLQKPMDATQIVKRVETVLREFYL